MVCLKLDFCFFELVFVILIPQGLTDIKKFFFASSALDPDGTPGLLDEGKLILIQTLCTSHVLC